MVQIIDRATGTAPPVERHVVVIVHSDPQTGTEKAYCYDSASSDHGGGGPFDLPLSEAIEKARRFALSAHLQTIFIKAGCA
jgi:hypothetical protein